MAEIAHSTSKAHRGHYNHARHEPVRNVLRWLIDNIAWRWLAKIERVEGLENLPESGPAILMINHIAFIDPIVVLGNVPRNIVPMAKRDVYRIPGWGIFPWLWNVIPVDRSGFDREAVRRALKVLQAGEIVLVAPEGTRHEALQDIKEGIAFLAYKADVPVIPVAVEGTQGFPSVSRKRWSQPGVVVRLGRPFTLRRVGRRPGREVLRKMTTECIYALAQMLPPHRRGEYEDVSRATTDYIVFH